MGEISFSLTEVKFLVLSPNTKNPQAFEASNCPLVVTVSYSEEVALLCHTSKFVKR